MPEIPPSLHNFSVKSHEVSPSTRLGLDEGENQGLRETGKQARVNVFARAWDFLTRTPEQVEQNKDVSKAFVQRIRLDYGDEVANMVGRELKDHIAHGRPLTAQRVDKLLDRSLEMKTRIEAGNEVV